MRISDWSSDLCSSDLDIRRRILVAFEHAELCDDPFERARLMTFVIVGGGPTGVELAGAIAELAKVALARDFRRIDPRQRSEERRCGAGCGRTCRVRW